MSAKLSFTSEVTVGAVAGDLVPDWTATANDSTRERPRHVFECRNQHAWWQRVDPTTRDYHERFATS